ncbi:MAG: hypothetical protein GC136_11020 [Alphaproteobacteria bacterium]|nr:hypothetical protein [Alphaproteobacteria bacterium]
MVAMAKTHIRSNQVRREILEEEFIPFACHYDPNTILTKNGELLQTIKLTGFSFESVNKNGTRIPLRKVVREVISASIDSSKYALWIHTVRRKKDLSTGGAYAQAFSEYVHKSWCELHDWEHKYVNELYITIISEGQDFNLDSSSFLRALSFKRETRLRREYLKKSAELLSGVTEAILGRLTDFGARRLTVIEHNDVHYSQPLQFYNKIIKLTEKPMPMPISDASDYISSTHDVAFGFNALEVRGTEGTKHFAAILTIKEYHEVTASAIDNFLQLDQEFIITETFDFINNDLVLKQYERQKYIFELSEDTSFSEISGFKEILDANRGRPTDFGEHQIIIMLLEDNLRMLEQETKRMVQALDALGLVVVREDVMIEECFWAQLPGNFEFLRRLSPINTSRIAGFASLYNFPAGRITGNHWGNAATVFFTKNNTPYFFNFHDGSNGHTTIIGPYGAGKTVLMNFLISESLKFNPRLIILDQHRASELFVRALGGKYQRITRDKGSTHVAQNPLLMNDTPRNREFLTEWLGFLMMDDNFTVPAEVKQRLSEAISYSFGLPPQERSIRAIAERFWPLRNAGTTAPAPIEALPDDLDSLLSAASGPDSVVEQKKDSSGLTPADRLAFWYGNGEMAHLFGHTQETLPLAESIFAFDITDIVHARWPIIPVFSYLMYRIRGLLDGKPTILVLDEAWNLVDNLVFAPKLGEWMQELREKNALVIFATESIENATQSSITNILMKDIATQIYLPNPEAGTAYKEVFGLNNNEFSQLKNMHKEQREFLLKHHGDAVVAKLDLKGLNDIIAILSGTRENIAILESIILETGEDPRRWLPVFREKAVKK